MKTLELYDNEGNLLGLFPVQLGACQNEDCPNLGFDIEVPDHPSVTLQCGCCGGWIIPPAESAPE